MDKWTARLLSLCFLANFFIQWGMLDVTLTEEGLRHFELSVVPPVWVSFASFLVMGLTVVLSLMVFPKLVHRGFSRQKTKRVRSLAPRTAVNVLAGLQVTMTVLTLFLLLYEMIGPGIPLLPGESVSPAQIWMFFVESYLMQVAILITFFFMGTEPRALDWVKPRSWPRMLVGASILYGLYFFLIDPLVTIPVADFFHLDLNSWRDTEIFHTMGDLWDLNPFWGFLDIFMISVVTGIAEEILFRGYIQGALVKRWGGVLGVLLTSLFFALIHADPIAFAPIFVLSLLLGYLKQYYRTLWGPIYIHAVNNGVSTVFTLLSV